VLRFVEKPDAAKAAEYVASGRFYWNSGMFCFPAGAMLQAMEQYCPEVLAGARAAYDAARKLHSDDREVFEIDPERFRATPAISLDYAVMEKAENVGCIALDCGWSDIGS